MPNDQGEFHNMLKHSERRSFLSSLWKTAASACLMNTSSQKAIAQGHASSLPDPDLKPSSDSLYDPSLASTSLRGEAADRLCIQRLIDGWAHYADRRLPVKQAALFTPDGVVNNYEGDPARSKPVSILRGREELVKALAVLNKFPTTFHFNGQSEIEVRGDKAVGETYCIAHQILREGGSNDLQILAIRYLDRFVRAEGRWFIAERSLIIDISDTRPSAARS